MKIVVKGKISSLKTTSLEIVIWLEGLLGTGRAVRASSKELGWARLVVGFGSVKVGQRASRRKAMGCSGLWQVGVRDRGFGLGHDPDHGLKGRVRFGVEFEQGGCGKFVGLCH